MTFWRYTLPVFMLAFTAYRTPTADNAPQTTHADTTSKKECDEAIKGIDGQKEYTIGFACTVDWPSHAMYKGRPTSPYVIFERSKDTLYKEEHFQWEGCHLPMTPDTRAQAEEVKAAILSKDWKKVDSLIDKKIKETPASYHYEIKRLVVR